MSARSVYTQVRELLAGAVANDVDASSLERLLLLVLGIICAESIAPAAIARALTSRRLSEAQPESVERQVRRTENDPEIRAELNVHPLARRSLCTASHGYLILVLDPTTKKDRVVKVNVNVWYRNHTLPLAWTTWPGNVPLTGDGFWQRIASLLAEVATLLPERVPVIVLADRAFGTPVFTDIVTGHGWHYVVRVQGQTCYLDENWKSEAVKELASRRRQVALECPVFKKHGWRQVSLVVRWAADHKEPLCVVSDLPCHWALLSLYRRRFAIEASFRHDKAYGWHLEQCQVINLDHLERLLVGMALATWITVLVGTQEIDEEQRTNPKRAQRLRRKYSVFTLGLHGLQTLLGTPDDRAFCWRLVAEPDPDEIQDLLALLLPSSFSILDLQDVNVLPLPVRP